MFLCLAIFTASDLIIMHEVCSPSGLLRGHSVLLKRPGWAFFSPMTAPGSLLAIPYTHAWANLFSDTLSKLQTRVHNFRAPQDPHHNEGINWFFRLLFVPGRTGHLQVLYPWFPWVALSLLGCAYGYVFARRPDLMRVSLTFSGVIFLTLFVGMCAGAGWQTKT